MGLVADQLFGASAGNINAAGAWLGAVSYMLQIYFDFSGYSDMAIGLGWMFGFHFKENFNYPYISGSIRDFWRRWHISLSGWFLEYLYIPLGGNRKGKFRTVVNKMIVFLCTGIWHGAAVNFLFWGVYHGCFLMLEEYVPWIGRKGSGVKSCISAHLYPSGCLHWFRVLQSGNHGTGGILGEKDVHGISVECSGYELCPAADDTGISGYPGRCADRMLSCYKNCK